MARNRIFKTTYLIIIFFCFLNCTDEIIKTKDYPTIKTLEVTDISREGAVYNATIDNPSNQQIIEYGFVWKWKGGIVRADPILENSDKVVLSQSIINDQFSEVISSSLSVGANYLVRAYIKTQEYLVYGNVVSFKSLGSNPPIFSDFSPKIGNWGDTIYLKGKGFSSVTNQNVVTFKNFSSKLFHSTDSTITCIVPSEIRDRFVPINVRTPGGTATSKTNFELISPQITSISPLNGTFGDELTITGENFAELITNNEVYFGNVPASITYADQNIIKVLVPNNIESSTESIKVISNLKETVYSSNFNLNTPEITSIEDGVYANSEITILLKNYHPVPTRTTILINNSLAEILDQNTYNFTVKVPWGPFNKRKFKIEVQVLDMIYEHPEEINILDKWVLVSDRLRFNFNRSIDNAVVANGHAYVVAPEGGSSGQNFDLWKFNSEEYTWQKITIPFSSEFNLSSGIVESDGKNIYVYIPNTTNDFWKFDTETLIWSQQSNFIGNKRNVPTHFSIGEDIYVGLGVDYEPSIPIYYSDFYKYTPSTDQWVRVSDVPFSNFQGGRIRTTSFVINGLGYFTGGALSTGDTDSWSYNPITDQWIQIADSPYAFYSGDAAFELNGFGYITGSGNSLTESWRYNPLTNIWERSDEIGKPRDNHFAFSINGRAYLGGGGRNFELFEYIP